jgi:hypothetical protein
MTLAIGPHQKQADGSHRMVAGFSLRMKVEKA